MKEPINPVLLLDQRCLLHSVVIWEIMTGVSPSLCKLKNRPQ